jgi:circadian clock protein KaiC
MKKRGSIKITKKKISKSKVEEYLKTGIKGFDSLFEDGYGVPSGSAVLIEGGPGSGKTIFCLSTVMGLCKQGKKCLYMSFEEPEEKLIEHAEHFNWPAKDYVGKGLLMVKRFDAIDVSRSVEALLSEAKKELLIEVDPALFPDDFKPDFVVIDSLTSIASAFSGQESRFRIYMEQLFRYLEKHNITNFLIREVASPSHMGSTFKEEGEAVSFLSDGIVAIYNVIHDSGERSAAIEIVKMRGVSFKKKVVEMRITNGKGVEINPDKILKKEGKQSFTFT